MDYLDAATQRRLHEMDEFPAFDHSPKKIRSKQQQARHDKYLRALEKLKKAAKIEWTITGEIVKYSLLNSTLTYRAEGKNDLGLEFTGEAVHEVLANKEEKLLSIENITIKK